MPRSKEGSGPARPKKLTAMAWTMPPRPPAEATPPAPVFIVSLGAVGGPLSYGPLHTELLAILKANMNNSVVGAQIYSAFSDKELRFIIGKNLALCVPPPVRLLQMDLSAKRFLCSDRDLIRLHGRRAGSQLRTGSVRVVLAVSGTATSPKKERWSCWCPLCEVVS